MSSKNCNRCTFQEQKEVQRSIIKHIFLALSEKLVSKFTKIGDVTDAAMRSKLTEKPQSRWIASIICHL